MLKECYVHNLLPTSTTAKTGRPRDFDSPWTNPKPQIDTLPSSDAHALLLFPQTQAKHRAVHHPSAKRFKEIRDYPAGRDFVTRP